jgi:hypothetical protein
MMATSKRLAVYFTAAMLPFAMPMARALGIMPMRIEQRSGQLQVSNESSRFERIDLKIYRERKYKGRSTADIYPLLPSEAESLIRLRPSTLRLGPGASRFVSYSIVQDQQSFFVCGISLQGLIRARVCSRWRSASSSLPKRP